MDMTDMTRAAVSRRHFLQLAGAGMLALTGTALTGCGNSTSGEGSDKGSKLAAIKSRGHLNAGVKKDVPGYGYYDTAKGRFEGMEVDLCYQIAAAVFGVSYKKARARELVEFTDVTPKTRGPLIDNGQLDVVAATYTITDERKKSWDFSTPYRTDYVGLMVKKRSGFTSIEDLDGKVCANSPSSTAGQIAQSYGATTADADLTGAMDMLNTKRVDGHINNVAAVDEYMKSRPDVNVKIAAIYEPAADQKYMVESAAMFRKDDQALCDKVSEIIGEMIKDKTLYNLTVKYFGQTVADSVSLYK